jgi:hypothetical protein
MPAKRAFLVGLDLQELQCAVGMEPFVEPTRIALASDYLCLDRASTQDEWLIP